MQTTLHADRDANGKIIPYIEETLLYAELKEQEELKDIVG